MTQHDYDKLLTSHQVGELLQVNPSSVNKWVNDGRIQAFRTPGGHRRIRVGDLVEFLGKHKMPVPRSLSAMSRRRVLIVDDNQKQLDALKRRLKPHAERVELATASNGIDALIQVGAFKPHAVVLDAAMGELDGMEVCRRLKANPETRGIDVIITTNGQPEAIENDAKKAGAIATLAKPIELPELLEQLGVDRQTSM
ncbi:MAG TPA: response regulator [Polyangia bacterium]|jgi:excisionase family DNA binding protein|nr:response regulator [Polyangia bacterium]